jgi:hypothetical protein
MRMRATLTVACLIAFGATACGGDGSGGTTTNAPTTTEAPTNPLGQTPPSDPDAALLTFDDESIPAITADGRVFKRSDGPQGFGPVAAALPVAPVVGPLVTAQLTPDGLAAVLAEADRLGLLQAPPDYGQPGITDQGYLTVTLTTSSGTYEHSLYAPGEETGDDDADDARARLDEFIDYVHSLQMHLGDELSDWQPYVPEQWVVDTSPYVESGSARRWAFDTEAVDGCATFPTSGGVDSVSGVYLATVAGDEQHLVEVRPALPFTEC